VIDQTRIAQLVQYLEPALQHAFDEPLDDTAVLLSHLLHLR